MGRSFVITEGTLIPEISGIRVAEGGAFLGGLECGIIRLFFVSVIGERHARIFELVE